MSGPAQERPVSHYMALPVAVELLLARHGREAALKVVRRELQRARRARSRRRFEFWTAVGERLAADSRGSGLQQSLSEKGKISIGM